MNDKAAFRGGFVVLRQCRRALSRLSASQIRAAIARGDFSAREVAESALERIEALAGKVHAFNAFLLVALLPFSRLVHALSVPLGYLARPYQIVIWYRQQNQKGLS